MSSPAPQKRHDLDADIYEHHQDELIKKANVKQFMDRRVTIPMTGRRLRKKRENEK